MKIIFATFLLIFTFQFSLAQAKPKAELFDELSLPSNCEIFKARMINVWQSSNLDEKKDLELYLVINDKPHILRALSIERLARGITDSGVYSIDKTRTKIIHTSKSSEAKIQFWIIQQDADISFLMQNSIDLSELNLYKPQLFTSSNWDDGICISLGESEHFSEILSANPELRGHIVIFESSAKNFSKTEKELLSEFTEKLNVPRSQLRTFFIKQPKNNMPYYEYWLVPKRRK